jgi:hypothetical protein
MGLGIAVMIVIILIDVALMALVMRLILKEPPRAKPRQHPYVLESANGADEAAQPEAESSPESQ